MDKHAVFFLALSLSLTLSRSIVKLQEFRLVSTRRTSGVQMQKRKRVEGGAEEEEKEEGEGREREGSSEGRNQRVVE